MGIRGSNQPFFFFNLGIGKRGQRVEMFQISGVFKSVSRGL